jgi:hypothetical protein
MDLKSSKAEEELLNQSEKAMEAAQVIRPEAHELDAIRSFCALEVKLKKDTEAIAKQLKDLRTQSKAIKDKLFDDVLKVSPHHKCLVLTKEDHKRIETMCDASGIPMVPMYLRIVRANKDSTITPEVIQEAIETLSLEDLRAQETANPETSKTELLKGLILDSMRRLIRSYTDSLKLMVSIPKGQSLYELSDATSEIADRMFQYWSLEQSMKGLRAQKKVPDEHRKAMSAKKEIIEAFFVRTGLTAQRLVVEGSPYRLVRSVSIQKQRLGIGKFETILDAVVQKVKAFKPQDLIRELQIQVTSLPPETKTAIKLCSVKATVEEP